MNLDRVRRALRTGNRARHRIADGRTIDGVMLLLAAATGLGTGLFAWLLLSLIELVVHTAWSDPLPRWQVVAVPTLGALLVGLLTTRLVPEARGGGVVATMESLALRGGRLRARVPIGATGATGVALGTGSSGGPEGPIVLIGGAIGSLLARLVPVGEDRTRSLVAAGAAAGIGASFNAPIGGMLFAIELLLGGIRRSGSLQVVVVAAVVGSVTARQLVGEGLTFRPMFGLGLAAPRELLLYAALGAAAALAAAGFRNGMRISRRVFRKVQSYVGRPLSVAFGGLCVGLIALVFPQVLGDGSSLPAIEGRSDPIQAMLEGDLGAGWAGAGLLLALAAAKVVATCASKGPGTSVGIFAPTLFTGAALGGAFGLAAAELFGPEVSPAAFALVGMAAVFAATARAPLTAILIVFELTGSYGLVLPLMVAVGVAIAVEEIRGTSSVYVEELREKGVLYGTTEDLDVLQTVEVSEVMTPDHPTVHESMLVSELDPYFHATGSHGFAVVDDDGRLVGMVARSDLGRDGRTVGEVCTRRVVTVAPDDPVFRGVRRMASLDVGRIPVVDPRTRRVLGMLRRADVVSAYQRGMERSVGAQLRGQEGRLRDLTGVRFAEFVLDEQAAAVGRSVAEVAWPPRTVVTSVRRRGQVVVPTGDTRLEVGDELTVLTADADAVRDVLHDPGGASTSQAPPDPRDAPDSGVGDDR